MTKRSTLKRAAAHAALIGAIERLHGPALAQNFRPRSASAMSASASAQPFRARSGGHCGREGLHRRRIQGHAGQGRVHLLRRTPARPSMRRWPTSSFSSRPTGRCRTPSDEANGLPTCILLSYGGTTIFGGARADLPVQSVKDLKGLKIAVQKADHHSLEPDHHTAPEWAPSSGRRWSTTEERRSARGHQCQERRRDLRRLLRPGALRRHQVC